MLRYAMLFLMVAGSQANPLTWFEPKVRKTPVGDFGKEPPFNNANGHVPEKLEDIQPGFFIFCRNQASPDFLVFENLTKLGDTCFEGTRKTVIIIHGYRDKGNVRGLWQDKMKDKILEQVDANVVVVCWNAGSDKLIYSQAAANTRVVGATGAKLIGFAKTALGLSLDKVHCIGHSLGSHTCGYLGSGVKAEFGQAIGRITGLDPAGPCFTKEEVEVRLDASDADFVDAIHTDCETLFHGGFGMFDRSGHQDFYPNGGVDQPGCPVNRLQRVLEFFTGGIGDYVDGLACSHMRVIDLFTESISASPTFVAQQCLTPEGGCWSCDAPDHACAKMGWQAEPLQSSQTYDLVMKTNDHAPFKAENQAV